MKTKVKREKRREDESPEPVDTDASTRNNAKIRVLNHKDYKRWKVGIGIMYSFNSFFEPWLVFPEDVVK